MRVAIFIGLLFVSVGLKAQNDTIRVKNGNVLFGEIKKLRSGVLTMKTSYSDSDFTVDFSEVVEISVEKKCFVILTGGRRRMGHIRSQKPNEFTFTESEGETAVYKMKELVVLDELDDRFWKRISGTIDVSYNLTKANNSSQLTIGGSLSYRGAKWVSAANITALNAHQDNVDDISRTDITGDIQRVLPRKWYLLGNLSFLSNTEQALKSRYSPRIGGGRYLALTNQLAWGISIGLNFNFENFSDLTPNRKSTELYLGSNFNMFDFKDWSLNTNINVFPSLSESGRWRVDYNLDIKWDLPYDFYIKTTLQFNYDNEAAAEGSNFDYVWTTGVGWEFN